jgi:hypothetical protein
MAKSDKETAGYHIKFKPTERNNQRALKGTITLDKSYEVLDRFYDKGTLKFLIADNRSEFLFVILDSSEVSYSKP